MNYCFYVFFFTVSFCVFFFIPLSPYSDIIRNAVNASSRDDCVLFAGSGCTGAVHKLIHSLNCHLPPPVSTSSKIITQLIFV